MVTPISFIGALPTFRIYSPRDSKTPALGAVAAGAASGTDRSIIGAVLADIPPDSILGRIVRAPLRLIPRATIVRIPRGPLKGRKWIVGASGHGCWLGTFEKDKVAAFLKDLRRDSVVYDIGANTGIYTLLAATRATGGHVYSFEPLPRNLEILRRHISLNKLLNCTVIEAAVDSSSGTAQFAEGSTPEMGALSPGGGLRVETVTLDHLRDSGTLAAPDLIKMDVEGNELEALRGAMRVLRTSRPILYAATHSSSLEADCGEFLRELGYSVALVPGSVRRELVARPA
jgi:FkbM family methyltransferase